MTTESESESCHPLLAAMAAVEGAVAGVVGVEPIFMGTAEKAAVLVAVTGMIERLGEVRLRVLACAEDVADGQGARDPGVWLAHHTRLDRGECQGLWKLARDLDTVNPGVRDALRDGRVTTGQARVITRTLGELPADLDPVVRDKVREHLVGLAAQFGPVSLRNLGRRVLAVIDPDAAEDHERARLEAEEREAEKRTFLRTRSNGDGTTDIHARVADPVAARLLAYLEAYSSPRRDHLTDHLADDLTDDLADDDTDLNTDPADDSSEDGEDGEDGYEVDLFAIDADEPADQPVSEPVDEADVVSTVATRPLDQPGEDPRPLDQPGEDPRPLDQPGENPLPLDQPGEDRRPFDQPGAPEDRRPYAQRLGHAFGSFLEAIDPARLPHGGDATTVMVTINLADLRNELAGIGMIGDQPMTAGQVRRLACTANLIPVVLGGDSEILDLGRTRRLHSRPQRKAMAIRDVTCRAEGCDIPATWCEAHHLTPWSHGGHTTLTDGVLLCAFHHHKAHDHRYDMRRLPDGRHRFTRRT